MKRLPHLLVSLVVMVFVIGAVAILWANDFRVQLTPTPPPTYNFYFGNLHSHTAYSDGTGTPAEAFKYARDTGGLDFLAITEHNHAAAENTTRDPAGLHIAKDASLYTDLINAANAANSNGSFVAIYGQEFSTIQNGGNHTNMFMASKVIETENGDYETVFTEDWMDEYDVEIIQMNHPWELNQPISAIGTPQDKNYGFNRFATGTAWREAVDGKASLIEVVNGPGLRDGDYEDRFTPTRKPQYYKRYLNLGLHLAPTADQDNHYRTWGTLTYARTVVLAPSLTRENILEALKERRVYASEDEDLKVDFTINGQVMGSILEAVESGDEVDVRVHINDDNDGETRYRVKLLYDNGRGGNQAQVVATEVIDNNGSTSITHTPSNGKGYYFLEILSVAGGNEGYMAWTAPIWFE